MSKVVTRSALTMVKRNKNGSTSSFVKTASGGWKKMGYSGNPRTKTGSSFTKKR